MTLYTCVCSRHFEKEDVQKTVSESGRQLLKKEVVLILLEWNNLFVTLSRPRVLGVEETKEDDAPAQKADTHHIMGTMTRF